MNPKHSTNSDKCINRQKYSRETYKDLGNRIWELDPNVGESGSADKRIGDRMCKPDQDGHHHKNHTTREPLQEPKYRKISIGRQKRTLH